MGKYNSGNIQGLLVYFSPRQDGKHSEIKYHIDIKKEGRLLMDAVCLHGWNATEVINNLENGTFIPVIIKEEVYDIY